MKLGFVMMVVGLELIRMIWMFFLCSIWYVWVFE